MGKNKKCGGLLIYKMIVISEADGTMDKRFSTVMCDCNHAIRRHGPNGCEEESPQYPVGICKCKATSWVYKDEEGTVFLESVGTIPGKDGLDAEDATFTKKHPPGTLTGT